MDRAEATGVGVAVAGHAALIALLAFGIAVTREPTPPADAMEVSFVEDAGPVSSAPETLEEPAPTIGDEISAPAQASGADASVAEPIVPPVPEPVRPPVETGERRRPDVTRNPVTIRPQPQPRVVQAQPRPQPRPSPTQSRPQRTRTFDDAVRVVGAGPPAARNPAPAAPAALSGAQRQQLARNISGLIAPCASRAQAPNGFARSISVDLRVTVTQAGVPTGHQLLGSSGTNESNSDYVDDVTAVAMRAVRACASRIATLPDDHYAIPGGWRTFRYRFRFPG
ncbi:MAG TPA: hypothetical protein VGB54_08445 [Allosphingosinicella sp.]|jgi:hypothetical protein